MLFIYNIYSLNGLSSVFFIFFKKFYDMLNMFCNNNNLQKLLFPILEKFPY